ncbi:Fic family protein [Winogradskyella endarachnes]|nr:Fic family protein [Winogradskyella endarachnes]
MHPFFDGNGRTILLAMNFLLMRAGFPQQLFLPMIELSFMQL